jgi:hypothetical protein
MEVCTWEEDSMRTFKAFMTALVIGGAMMTLPSNGSASPLAIAVGGQTTAADSLVERVGHKGYKKWRRHGHHRKWRHFSHHRKWRHRHYAFRHHRRHHRHYWPYYGGYYAGCGYPYYGYYGYPYYPYCGSFYGGPFITFGFGY